MLKNKHINKYLILLITCISMQHHINAQAKEIFTFGIVPQQSASKLARTWTPFMKYLSKQTGITIRFVTAPNIPTFEKRLKSGKYDIAYMNPYHYVVYSQNGYQAIAKARNKKIYGILVTKKDSPIKSLEDLDNRKLAFPAPKAFAASLLTQNTLQQRSISFTPVYVSSHDSVYRNIVANNFAAGGGVVRTLNATKPEIQDNLRILFMTPGYTPHAFAVQKEISDEIKEKIITAMTNMHNSEEGKKLLKVLKINGIERANDQNWDDVRSLNIKQ